MPATRLSGLGRRGGGCKASPVTSITPADQHPRSWTKSHQCVRCTGGSVTLGRQRCNLPGHRSTRPCSPRFRRLNRLHTSSCAGARSASPRHSPLTRSLPRLQARRGSPYVLHNSKVLKHTPTLLRYRLCIKPDETVSTGLHIRTTNPRSSDVYRVGLHPAWVLI